MKPTISTQKLRAAYRRLGSYRAVADLFGLSYTGVYQRLHVVGKCRICRKPVSSAGAKTCCRSHSALWRKRANRVPKSEEVKQHRSENMAAQGEDHFRALNWTLKSPAGQIFHATNMAKFIRDHTELFAPNPLELCAKQLSRLGRGEFDPWKGWRVLSVKPKGDNDNA